MGRGSRSWDDKSYSLWRGSAYVSPKNRARPHWEGQDGWKQPSLPTFPAFDAMPSSSSAKGPKKEAEDTSVRAPGVFHGLQEALTAFSKAEGRVDRCLKTQERTSLLWQEYQKKMKDALMREKSRFQARMAKLAREHQDAELHREAARACVRNFYTGQQDSTAVPTPMEDGDAEVEAMFDQWMAEKPPGQDYQALLSRALGRLRGQRMVTDGIPGPSAPVPTPAPDVSLEEQLRARRALNPFGLPSTTTEHMRPTEPVPTPFLDDDEDDPDLDGGLTAEELARLQAKRDASGCLCGGTLAFAPGFDCGGRLGLGSGFASIPFVPASLAFAPAFFPGAGAVNPARRPHDIDLEELAHHIGQPLLRAGPLAPTLFDQGQSRVIPLDCVTDLPEPVGGQDARWLGVAVFTPHYRPVRLAVLCPPGQGLDYVTDVVLQSAPGAESRLFDRCVPARPLQFHGWCTLVRFPSIASMSPDGVMRAVMVDLTMVGGHYYACLLPEDIAFDELMHFATQQASYSDVDIVLHVGNSPVAHEADVNGYGTRPLKNYSRMLNHGSRRLRCRNFLLLLVCLFTMVLSVSLCRGTIIMGNRLSLQYPRCGIIECTVCVFLTPDLEYRGNPCMQAACVVNLPSAQLDAPLAWRRRDFFALCDFRGLGYGIRIAYSNVPWLHLPSVAAVAGVHLPPNLQLAAVGWEPLGDEAKSEQAMEREVTFPDTGGLLHSHSITGFSPPLATCKLLREPTSHTVAQRERIDQARDFVRQAGRQWGYLPADDEFAGDHDPEEGWESDVDSLQEGEAEFTFFVLRIEYVPEIVLDAPVAVQEALALIPQVRDPVSTRLYPYLIVVDPQPSQASGLLLSMPGWATDEIVVCCDLSAFDGRLFAADAPAVASREVILRMCELDQEAAADIYVGTGDVPLVDREVPLRPGVCISVVRRFALPGPFYSLRETLQSSATWDDEPQLPIGPAGGGFCAVSEQGHRRFPVDPTAFFADRRAVANAFAIQVDELVIQPAVPVIGDVAMKGVYCRNVCAIATARDPVTLQPAPDLLATVVDCRALLQGWLLLTSEDGRIDKEDLVNVLSTFAPPGWCVHLEGLLEADGTASVLAGRPVYASFVPLPALEGHEEEDGESETPADIDMVVDAGPVTALNVPGPAYAEPAVDTADVSPDRNLLRLLLALTFGLVPRFQRQGQYDVYVPNSDTSLQPRQECFLQHGSCVVIVPAPGRNLVASSLLAMLASADGWGTSDVPPVVAGDWVHVIGEEGPTSFCHAVGRRRFLGQALSEALHLPSGSFAAQHACPDLCDYSDAGRSAHTVVAVTQAHLVEPDETAAGCVCFLDLRALNCGLTWAFTPDRFVSPSPYVPLSKITCGSSVICADRVIKCPPAFTHHAFPDSKPWLTPVLSALLPVDVETAADLLPLDYRPHSCWKLLCEPVASAAGADHRFAAARTATRLLGQRWPFDPAWSPVMPVQDDDVHSVSSEALEGDLVVEAVFCLFAPGYTPECGHNPSLHGVHFLLSLGGFNIGLHPVAEVDVFLPEAIDPMPAGGDFHVQSGMCIVFLPIGRVPAEHYLIATDQGISPFRLLPERSMFLRADLPLQRDATVYGYPCRNVVLLTHDHGPRSDEEEISCLVDCRPLLLGWLPLYTNGGHVNLNFLKASLQPSASEGWEVNLRGIPRHWTWTWLEPGQVIAATLVRRVVPTVPAADVHGEDHGTSDDNLDGHLPHASAANGQVDHHGTGPGSEVVDAALAPLNTGYVDVPLRTRQHLLWGLLATAVAALSMTGLLLLCSRVCVPCSYHHVTGGAGEGTRGILALAALGTRRRALGFAAISAIALAIELPGVGAVCPSGVDVVGVSKNKRPDLASTHGPRPLPTPCRSLCHNAGPVTRVSRGSGHGDGPIRSPCPERLVTLLEESVQCTGGYPFFLAATLVDTLVEHFAVKGHGSRSDGPRALSLCDLVAPPRDDLLAWSIPLWQVPCLSHRLASALDKLPCPEPLSIGPLNLGFNAAALRDLLQQPCLLAPVSALQRFATAQDRAKIAASRSFADDLQGEVLHCFTDGSFTPPSHGSPALCGWACVFVHPRCAAAGVVSGTVPQALLAGDETSAFVAECCALIAALRISACYLDTTPLVFGVDCLAALGLADGTMLSSGKAVAGVLFRIGSMNRMLCPATRVFRHTPGHSKILANEIADLAARQAAQGHPVGQLAWEFEGSDTWWCDGGTALDWAGLALTCHVGHSSLPPLRRGPVPVSDSDAGLGPAQLLGPFRPDYDCEDQPAQRGTLRLTVGTYNVLSLCGKSFGDHPGAGLAYVAGRPTLLANCLQSHKVDVLAVQEARTEAGTVTTGNFIRYCSGALKGNFGTELWFREGARVVTASAGGEAQVCFRKQHFIVLHADPRRLLVLFHSVDTRLVFASLHGPHKGSEAGHLDSWWRETNRLLAGVSARGDFVLLGDFNADLGSVESCAVGVLGATEQDSAGEFLHDLVLRSRLWIPSTWSDVHVGPCGTYLQKRNGAESRLDYVCLPQACRHPRRGHKGRRFDAQAMLTPGGRDKVANILRHAPLIPWHVSADAHAAQLVGYVQRELELAFPAPKGKQRHPFLSDHTWPLHARAAHLRRRLARLRVAVRFHSVAAAFSTWRYGRGTLSEAIHATRWMRQAVEVESALAAELQDKARSLRLGCRADRTQYLSALADQVGEGKDASFEALRKLLGHKKRKPFTPEVLPQLLDEHGVLCPSPAATTARWRQHFSDIEGGYAATPEQIANLCAPPAIAIDSIPLEDFPAPADLLNAILSAKTGKASGPDGVPVEFGKACPALWQGILLPLLLKVGLHCREPIGLKSGILTWMYKGKGSKLTCASYRAIMLLSTVAKTLHRAFRPALYRFFDHRSLPVQIGGKKSTTVLFGAHLSRSFLAWRASRSLSGAILFADVAAAYYNAVRGLTARDLNADDPAGPLVPPEVATRLEEPSALRAGGAEPWLEALTHDFNHNTWMTLKGDCQHIVTTKGSRPGSSWADLFFGVTVPGILALRDQLRAEVLGETVCSQPNFVLWDGARTFSSSIQPSIAAPLTEVVWADDVSSYLCLAEPSTAAFRLGVETSVLVDAFAGYGYSLSFGPGKTAAVVALRGKGARQARRCLFTGTATVPVVSEHRLGERLPLVSVYKHLGVQVAAAGSEVKQRIAQAWVAFRQGRTKVYRSKRLTLVRKGNLLRSLVLSRLLFGSGSWGTLRIGEFQAFSRCLGAMYRQCLCVHPNADQEISTEAMCSLLGQPDALTILRVERLRYARQLVATGPDVLWALLKHEAAFTGAVQDACRWLYRWVCDTSPLGDPATAWDGWVRVMLERPRLFRGLIKRARALECLRLGAYAAFQAVHKALCLVGCATRPDATDPDAVVEFRDACLLCRVAFSSRAAWAVHAAKCHGYRAPATLLAREQATPFCAGCGRLYANHNRLRRHLLHAAVCRTRWGAFQPEGGTPCTLPALHEQRPPCLLPGEIGAGPASVDASVIHPGLLEALLHLPALDPDLVWSTVVDFVEPLSVLKATLEAWAVHEHAQPGCAECASDAVLLLDPELWCDDFRRPKAGRQQQAVCAALAPPKACRCSFVLTGPEATFRLDEPPLPSMVYPFQASVPLACARRHFAWLEQACDSLGAFFQASASSPASFLASGAALRCLEPLTSWAVESGFEKRSRGLFTARE
ncbi:unnamed protein product [Symbiodinium sp. CCMP2592]|nr:unnamed protein product [Symbiodinium sp. CCMP2592]